MSFDARHPDHHPPPMRPVRHPAGLAPVKVPPVVLAKVGETFAVALSALQRSLSALGDMAPAQQALLEVALGEVARLEYLGVRLQELARVLAGDAPAPPERVELARAAREAMAAWEPAAQSLGATFAATDESLVLQVNGAVLGQLLDLALEHALRVGPRVEIRATRQGQAAHPMLSIQAHRSQPLARGDEELDGLHWLLFNHLARAAGLVPQRRVEGQSVALTLFFPGGGDAPVADEGALSPAWRTRTDWSPAKKVLLIEPHDMVRVQAYRLMSEAGMRVDSAVTLEQARAGLREGPFDAIVTGVPVDDPRAAALLEDARVAAPGLLVVELVDDESAFSLAVPGSHIAARVGRKDIAHTLLAALSQEPDA